MAKKVILAIASNGYQEQEYNETKKVLEDSGLEVVTVSDTDEMAIGHEGNQAKVDIPTKNINPALYSGMFIIGGPGALACLDNEKIHQALSEFFATQKPYGAICISPRILAKAQVLRGKNATCWDGDGKTAEAFEIGNVTFESGPVVVDGKIVTADGPDAAQEFGKAIVNLIK